MGPQFVIYENVVTEHLVAVVIGIHLKKVEYERISGYHIFDMYRSKKTELFPWKDINVNESYLGPSLCIDFSEVNTQRMEMEDLLHNILSV